MSRIDAADGRFSPALGRGFSWIVVGDIGDIFWLWLCDKREFVRDPGRSIMLAMRGSDDELVVLRLRNRTASSDPASLPCVPVFLRVE